MSQHVRGSLPGYSRRAARLAILVAFVAVLLPTAIVAGEDGFAATTDKRAGLDWWSLQPIHRPEVPAAQAGGAPLGPVGSFALSHRRPAGRAHMPPRARG